MPMINSLDIAPVLATADLPRVLRSAQWWANLQFAQKPINIYRDANGILTMSDGAGSGTLIATVQPNTFYMSGSREEWRERFMLLGDRRY